jgi:hypothetical protein
MPPVFSMLGKKSLQPRIEGMHAYSWSHDQHLELWVQILIAWLAMLIVGV